MLISLFMISLLSGEQPIPGRKPIDGEPPKGIKKSVSHAWCGMPGYTKHIGSILAQSLCLQGPTFNLWLKNQRQHCFFL